MEEIQQAGRKHIDTISNEKSKQIFNTSLIDFSLNGDPLKHLVLYKDRGKAQKPGMSYIIQQPGITGMKKTCCLLHSHYKC